MQSSPFVEKAIPMVSVDEKSGKYVLTEQALNFFKAINGPIAVVSVAGLYRTGKSYLLNRVLLNRSNGFGVGPTVNPCTKGLWCWGMPIKGTSTDGEPVNIIVIDTEGIGALDEDQTHDTKIFTLAILASSCFIYNSVGSIDQTAIQNLSLVVNLTKHIQLKSDDQSEEGEDPDEISMYFPTFYWVVRDFSLQLQDPEGNPMSSKEYLERALAPQNGFSDDIEQKNRIRRLLTAFFKDRDCFTMIRPLVDQAKLQNLDKMDYDELRLEFVQQAMSFRKRIVNSVKPKTLQNQKLNGVLYCSMINSYVNAINEGAVPNIENAWNYMCEQQCRRAINECFEIFVISIQETLKDLPRSQEDFNRYTSEAEEKAIEAYREKSLGPQAAQGLIQLKSQIKDRIQEMLTQNIKESSVILKEYIRKSASLITKKLNSQQYTTYNEYEKEVSAMGQKFRTQGPKLHNYKQVYLEALRKLLAQGADFLFKSFTKQQDKTNQMFKEKQKQLTGEIQNLKTECQGLRKKYNESMTEADRKILDLTNREENLQKQLDITIQSKKDQESKMERYYGSKEMENKSMLRTLEEKLNDTVTKLDESTRKFLCEQQEWLKEKAIFEQQLKFQAKEIEELQKKEKSLDAAINLSKTNMSKEVREITMRLETDRDNMKNQLEAKTQKLNDLTEELNNIKAELADKTDLFERKQKKFKEDMNNFKKETEKARKDLELEKKQLKDDMQNQETLLRDEIQLNEAKLRQSEKALKELTDTFRLTKSDLQKQKSLLQQEMGYIKQENQSFRSKVQQLKESHEMALASYEASINQENQQNMSKHIIEMKNQHTSQIQRLNHTFESEKNRMTCEFNNLKSEFFEMETRYNAYRTQKELLENERKSEIEDLKTQISNLYNDKSKLIDEHHEELDYKQSEFEQEIKSLKQELEECKILNNANYQRVMKQYQTELQRMRHQSNDEVTNIKRKMKEEKEKLERKAREEREECEQQFQEQKEKLEQQIEQLMMEFKNAQAALVAQTKEGQHNIDLFNKQIANLTKINKEIKQNLERKEQQFAFRQESITKEYKVEKEKMEKKIQQLVNDSKVKEMETLTIRHQKEQLASYLEKKESQLVEAQNLLKKSEQKYKIECEKLTIKQKEMENDAMEKLSVLSTKYALLEQQFKFQADHARQLQSQLATAVKAGQEKYETYKNDKQKELNTITSKLTSDKAQLDSKYQQLKNSSKELEKNLRMNISDAQKTNAVLLEKVVYLELRLSESQASKSSELINLKEDLTKTKQALALKQKQYKEAFNIFNNRVNQLDSEKKQLMVQLDTEKQLSKQATEMNKKAQREAQRDVQQRIKKLEVQLNHERSCRASDKSSFDSNHAKAVNDLNISNAKKINELSEALTKLKFDYQSMVKDKDLQIKDLIIKYQNEKSTRASDINAFQRRIQELTLNNKKITEEYDKIKKEKSGREGQRFTKEGEERDQLKKKITALELLVKDKQQVIMKNQFDLEKERMLWNMEKDHLNEKINACEEVVAKLNKDLAKLNNQKEKLKNTRTSNATRATSFISNMKTTYEPKTEKSTIIVDNNKENTSYQ